MAVTMPCNVRAATYPGSTPDKDTADGARQNHAGSIAFVAGHLAVQDERATKWPNRCHGKRFNGR